VIRSQKKLGEILIDRGLITSGELKVAVQEQVRTKEFLGTILVKNRQIKEEDLLAALSEQFNMPVVNLKNKYIDWNFVASFSAELILNYRCFPVQRKEGAITIAITNPLDVWALKKAEEETGGFKLQLVLASEGDMEGVIRRYKQYLRGDLFRKFK